MKMKWKMYWDKTDNEKWKENKVNDENKKGMRRIIKTKGEWKG